VSTPRTSLINRLRSSLSDDKGSVAAFTLSVTGECKSALLELTNGFFSVTVARGNNVNSIRLDLSNPAYNTTGKLLRYISALKGYSVAKDENFDTSEDFPSSGMVIDHGLQDISNGSSCTVKHNIFSNEELRQVLEEAVSLHNPNYTINRVPVAEHPYVLQRARAIAYRILATDAAKRSGIEGEAKVFLGLAKDQEDQYNRDVKRQQRIIPSPKIDESKIGSGDTIQGELFRPNLRTGYDAPYRSALPPESPVLLQPSDDDIEDTLIRLRWNQDRDSSFLYYELWRDTQSNVERSIAGRLDSSSNTSAALPVQTQYEKATTAVQVMGLTGNRTSPVFDGFYMGTFAEQSSTGLVKSSFIDGVVVNNPGAGSPSVLGAPLEPETDYYYRLYAINRNGEVQHSNVLHVRTKAIRALFARLSNGALDTTNAISPTSGTIAGGTAVTITGTDFVEGIYLTIGGKRCTEVSRSSTQLVVTTPGMSNSSFADKALDLALYSPTGLVDIVKGGYTYT